MTEQDSPATYRKTSIIREIEARDQKGKAERNKILLFLSLIIQVGINTSKGSCTTFITHVRTLQI
jgi:hypothetical protein